jgi:hypothetical protein
MAEERGIELVETKDSAAEDFTELVTVRVQSGDGEVEVAGTSVGPRNEPYLVSAAVGAEAGTENAVMALTTDAAVRAEALQRILALDGFAVGRSVDLTPPTTMVAAFIGAAVAGVPGALVATPLVGAAKQIYLEARGKARPDPEEGMGFIARLRNVFHRKKR